MKWLWALAFAATLSAADPAVTARFHTLLDREWQWTLEQDPEFASSLGDVRYNGQWPDVSLAAIAARYEHRVDVLRELDRIPRAQLSPEDQLNYDLFRRTYQTEIEGYPYAYYVVPVTMREGIQQASLLADQLPFRSAKDYEDWIARMKAFPRYMDQTIALMEEGIRRGMVQPKVIMERVAGQIDHQIVSDPTESSFYKPFRKMPDSLSEAERERLKKEAKEAVEQAVIPAFRKFRKFFADEYLAAAPEEVGMLHWPNGKQHYAYRAKLFTTTNLTPEEIHQTGQREVKRIRAEMEKTIRQTGFTGTFAGFLEHLRTDPKFYYPNADELLTGYRALAKQVDPTLGRLFGKLPRTQYGVEPIPAAIAPDTTTAYYMPPSADGLRAGAFSVNLYKPEVRPKYEMEALTMHEAVPGHHLQIALAMELENLPEFRRYGMFTAFVEGWGLYAESLGYELGFYQDPYSKFGQLTYDMWRAVRLVVDTGMHDMGWTRQQAIDFFLANAAKTRQDVVNEIDRYIGWPGQALAYKIGQLKIRELRTRAEQRLGDRFDVRAFHDAVLRNGALPLDVLEAQIDRWIAQAEENRD